MALPKSNVYCTLVSVWLSVPIEHLRTVVIGRAGACGRLGLSFGSCFLRSTSHGQIVLHLEDSGHLACTHFCNLTVRCVVDDSQEHGSAAFDNDVDWIAADRLHAGKTCSSLNSCCTPNSPPGA
jgi:hypothetical protein